MWVARLSPAWRVGEEEVFGWAGERAASSSVVSLGRISRS